MLTTKQIWARVYALKRDKNLLWRALHPYLKIAKNANDCWEWKGGVTKSGYALFDYKNRGHLLHRTIFMLFKEDLLSGMEIDHICNNRLCSNPNHLEQVTHQVNVQLASTRRQQLEEVKDVVSTLDNFVVE